MGTISITTPSDGQTIDASDVNNPLNTIVNVINGNLDSNNISAGGVTPANLTSGTGSSWAWQAWTPTFTNWTIGTGGSAGTTAVWCQVGKTVFWRLKTILGSSGQSVGTAPTFTLPVAVNSGYNADSDIIGHGTALDTGVAAYPIRAYLNSTTVCQMILLNAGGTYVGYSPITSTAPHVWAAADRILLQGSYEVA